jgi:hypothetical protein
LYRIATHACLVTTPLSQGLAENQHAVLMFGGAVMPLAAA